MFSKGTARVGFMTETLYDTLGVDKSASQSQLKTAYRDRARQTHPDHHPEKADEFKAVTSAYQVLADPDKRKLYDETGTTNQLSEEEYSRQQVNSNVVGILHQVVENFF